MATLTSQTLTAEIYLRLQDNAANYLITDSSGNGHNGTASFQTSAKTVGAFVGRGFGWLASGDYISIDNTTYYIGGGKICISFYYSGANPITNQSLIYQLDDSSNPVVIVHINTDGYWYAEFYNSDGNVCSAKVAWSHSALAPWHHICAIFDKDALDGKAKIWNNGTVGTIVLEEHGDEVRTTTTPLKIFDPADTNNKQLNIDEILIFEELPTSPYTSYDLMWKLWGSNRGGGLTYSGGYHSPIVILEHFGLAATYSADVFFKMDENEDNHLVNDSSGNGHNGTLAGSLGKHTKDIYVVDEEVGPCFENTVTDYIVINNTNWCPDTDSFLLTMWVKDIDYPGDANNPFKYNTGNFWYIDTTSGGFNHIFQNQYGQEIRLNMTANWHDGSWHLLSLALDTNSELNEQQGRFWLDDKECGRPNWTYTGKCDQWSNSGQKMQIGKWHSKMCRFRGFNNVPRNIDYLVKAIYDAGPLSDAVSFDLTAPVITPLLYAKCNDNAENSTVVNTYGTDGTLDSINSSVLHSDEAKIENSSFDYDGQTGDSSRATFIDVLPEDEIFVSCWVYLKPYPVGHEFIFGAPNDSSWSSTGWVCEWQHYYGGTDYRLNLILCGLVQVTHMISYSHIGDGWHHLCTYINKQSSTNSVMIWWDGNWSTGQTNNNAISGTIQPFSFGGNGLYTGRTFQGRLQQVLVYQLNRADVPQMVKDLWNEGEGTTKVKIDDNAKIRRRNFPLWL